MSTSSGPVKYGVAGAGFVLPDGGVAGTLMFCTSTPISLTR